MQSAFWVSASPDGFYERCADESARMRLSREAWLMSSGKVMEPRLWRSEEDYRQPKKQQEAAA